MVHTKRLAGCTSKANNISLQAGISQTPFVEDDLTPSTCKSLLKQRLQLAMADCFLDFNLQELLKVLACIKQSKNFNYPGVRQDFLPAPPALQCIMTITFLEDKTAIRVIISRQGEEALGAKSRKKGKINTKLVDAIQYLEETYLEL